MPLPKEEKRLPQGVRITEAAGAALPSSSKGEEFCQWHRCEPRWYRVQKRPDECWERITSHPPQNYTFGSCASAGYEDPRHRYYFTSSYKMPRVPFVGGNFKCTGTASSLTALVKEFNGSLTDLEKNVEVVIAPGTGYLGLVKSCARREIGIAAQNCISKSGAFTGEMSAEQVKDLGIQYVILGHSERRHVFGENSATIQKKVEAAVEKGLTVILCVGETLQEREAGRTQEVCFEQLSSGVANLPESAWGQIVVAYEPVWAIGTGKVATPEQAQEVMSVIRKWISTNVSPIISKSTRLIYGGSVNAKNCASLWSQPDMDGFLVGGASTKPEFANIVRATTKSKL